MRKKWLILLFIKEVAALTLSQCGTDNTLEVVSGTDNAAVCSGLTGQSVMWIMVMSGGWQTLLGSCEASRQCINVGPPDFIASRPSDAESILTINTRFTLNDTLTCQAYTEGQPGLSEISCLIDTVIPAEESCIVEFRRNTTPWSVFSQCNITRAYSSRGRYSCQWYQTYKTTVKSPLGSSVLVTQLTQISEKNFAGSCVLPTSVPLPPNEGQYSYKVTFIPGRNNVTATFIGTNEIVRPTLPRITCNNVNVVPENTRITCFCETSNVGKPGGRLKWLRLYGAQQAIIINTGNYDVERLDITSQTLNRTDEGLQFRCDVEWAETITGNAVVVRVGYIDVTQLMLNNSSAILTVDENESVLFDCRADGRPEPRAQLYRQDTLLNRGTSPLLYTVSIVQCNDTARYRCLTSNGMGPDSDVSANLYVNCKPRIHTGNLAPDTLRPMKYNGQAVTQTFSVMAFPAPSNFSFFFLGSGTGACTCKSDVKNIVLNMTCMSSQSLFLSTCTLYVDNVTTLDSAGIYNVTVTNTQGSMVLTFQVDVADTEHKSETSAGFGQGIGVGLGIFAAVLAIFALLTAIYLRRRHQKLMCVDKTKESHNSSLAPLTVNKDVSEIPVESALVPLSSLYDPLRRNEIGQASHYSDLSQYESVDESGKLKEPENRNKGTPLTQIYHNTSFT